MTNLPSTLAPAWLINAHAAPVAFAECFTVMSGQPSQFQPFENPGEGTGVARVVNAMIDQLAEDTGDVPTDKIPDLRTNRLVITTEDDRRKIEMCTALDPKRLFVSLELRRNVPAQPVTMKTPSDLIRSEFECLDTESLPPRQ